MGVDIRMKMRGRMRVELGVRLIRLVRLLRLMGFCWMTLCLSHIRGGRVAAGRAIYQPLFLGLLGLCSSATLLLQGGILNKHIGHPGDVGRLAPVLLLWLRGR